MRNKELEVIQKNKYLGVVIDNSLNWKEHIKSVSAKVSKAICFLRHATAFLPQETLNTLVLWSHTSDIVALFGIVRVQQRLTSYKTFNTELLEL